MALANYTVAGLGAATPVFAPTSAEPLRVPLDDLLYSPADHQPDAPAQHPSHEPFAPPSSHAPQRRSKLRKRAGSQYLPPPNQYQHYPRPEEVPHNPYGGQLHAQVYQHQHQQNTRLDISIENQRVHEVNAQYDNTGQYIHDPTGDYDYEQRRTEGIQRAGYRPGYSEPPYPPATTPSPLPPPSSRRFDGTQNTQNVNYNFVNVPVTSPSPLPPQPLLPQPLQPQPLLPQPLQPQSLPQRPLNEPSRNAGGSSQSPSQNPPDRPPGFTKVEPGGGPGSKTQLHAVLDYDDDYYDDVPGPGASQPAVTPLQGPILLRNGTVPVVPLTSYQTVNNGSFYQIPILWTALSLALGYELQGQIIKGVPCVKRNFQLYCPTAGNTYPLDKIETFIDENKALIKRMYGSFATPGGSRVRRAPGVPDVHEPGVHEADAHAGESFFRHARQARQSSSNAPLPDPQSVNSTGRIDACESKTEIMTPYWALNSARKLRAIVNTMHFEQAIHQEVCSKKSTSRCSGDCGCEQKYKWHRLLAYDPNDDCAGIFMDWFLFPSCCVCRCNP